VAQLATQVGFALDHARTLAQVDTRAEQAQILIDISQHLQESSTEEEIFNTTVERVRKAVRADRVVVYIFNGDGGGKVVAESVLVGWPHAMDAKSEDACIPESLRETYRAGRVVSTANMSEAGLHPDHLKLMEQLKIQSSLIAPLLSDGHLVGLLIVHQCSGPRVWQQTEIDLVAQVATQVGVTLHSANVLDQVAQAYQVAESTSVHQHQQLQKLQQQVLTWLGQNEPAVKAFSGDVVQQMESVTVLYQHLKLLASEIQENLFSLSQQQDWQQHTHGYLSQGQDSLESLHQCLSGLQTNGAIAAERIQHLSNPTEQVAHISTQMTQLASQMKLQAMNAALEATRKGESAKEFASIGEKVLDLARQLDVQTVDLAAISKLLKSQLAVASGALQDDTQQRNASLQTLEQVEQIFAPILAANTQLQTWLESMIQSIQRQADTSTQANQTILEVASHTNQATEHALLMSNTLDQLTTLSEAEEPV
jgi:methyl-accepting chemotaxis protein PixJ